MNSFNHYSFGSIAPWLLERSLGITILEDKVVELCPTPDPTGHLTWTKGHYDSHQGRIESAWECLPDGKVKYTFTIPEGVEASVTLPGQKPKTYKGGSYTKTL